MLGLLTDLFRFAWLGCDIPTPVGKDGLDVGPRAFCGYPACPFMVSREPDLYGSGLVYLS